MSGFEPRISGVGSDQFATTAIVWSKFTSVRKSQVPLTSPSSFSSLKSHDLINHILYFWLFSQGYIAIIPTFIATVPSYIATIPSNIATIPQVHCYNTQLHFATISWYIATIPRYILLQYLGTLLQYLGTLLQYTGPLLQYLGTLLQYLGTLIQHLRGGFLYSFAGKVCKFFIQHSQRSISLDFNLLTIHFSRWSLL